VVRWLRVSPQSLSFFLLMMCHLLHIYVCVLGEERKRFVMRILPLYLLVFCVTATRALYGPSSPVLSLDPSNFDDRIKRGGIFLVEFYAPW
jgi:hypothetical protein